MRRALDWLVVDAVGRVAGVDPRRQSLHCGPATTPVCNRTRPGLPEQGRRERHAQADASCETAPPQPQSDPLRH